METMIATAFGRYANIQRGEADELTLAANGVFHACQEGSPHGADLLIAILCKCCVRAPTCLSACKGITLATVE